MELPLSCINPSKWCHCESCLQTKLTYSCKLAAQYLLTCEGQVYSVFVSFTLQWHHNERNDISNHWHFDCLLNHLLAQIKESIKAPRHWPMWGEFTGEFPAQRASTVENVSIWRRHHEVLHFDSYAVYTRYEIGPHTLSSTAGLHKLSNVTYKIAILISTHDIGLHYVCWKSCN